MELIKPIVKVGNSAGVILPREWYGGEARIELIEKPFNLKKDILEILEPYLEDVIGIYLVGSYARGEQTNESDVDVIVITNNVNKRIEKGKYEIILISKDSIKKQLKNNLLPLLPMLKEAKPLMNSKFLEEYNDVKLTKKNLNFHIETTKSAMKVIEKSVDLDKDMGIKAGDGSAYSLILRLRGIYIVDCLKNEKQRSKKEFLRLIKKVSGSLNAYKGYLRVKSDKKTKDELPLEEAEKLHNYIMKKINEQGEWIKKLK